MTFFKDGKLRNFVKTCVFTCVTFLATASFATPSPYLRDDDTWKFEIAPYIWAVNMNGTVQTGPLKTHVSQSFSDLLSDLNIAGMIWLDASKGKWDIFLNLMYASLSDNGNAGPVKTHLSNDFGLFTGGVAYEVYRTYFPAANPFSYLAFNPYIGARDTLNNTTVSLKDYPLFSLSDTNNQNWVDPIIGLRVNYIITKAWLVTLAGDIGGTNAANDYSYNVMGLLGYSPQSHWTNTTIYLGYRLLDQHYEHGSGLNKYNWNMKIYGPLVGLAIKF